MSKIRSIQLMARVTYEDGVVAMLAHPIADLTDGPTCQDQTPWTIAAHIAEQSEELRKHALGLGPKGIHRVAVEEAATRREQITKEAEEAERRMRDGQRMGPRRRVPSALPQDGVVVASEGDTAAQEASGLAEGAAAG